MLRKRLGFLSLAMAMLLVANQARAVSAIGKCYLRVHRKTYIDGRCRIERGIDGAYTISSLTNEYLFATIFIPEGNVAEGNWTGTRIGSLAERFDTLHRHGACWVSDSAKVCAYH